MTQIEEWVSSELRAGPPPEVERVNKQTVAPRIAGIVAELLDEVALKMGRTRTRLAGELLELAIVEAGRVAGIEIFGGHLGEEPHIGFVDRDEATE